MQGSFALYEAFINVYEHNGYLEASKALNNGDPEYRSALKNNVKKLEEIFEVKLFQPTDRGILPTPDGENLYQSIKKILQQFEEVENDIRTFTEKSFFAVRIAIPSIFSTAQFVSLISDFRKKYVNAEIEFITVDCVNALKNKRVDFAISFKSDFINEDFDVEDLYEDELVILHKDELSLTLPINFENITFVVSKGMSDLFYKATGIEIKPKLKVDTTEQIYSFVKNGVADCGLYWKTATNENMLNGDKLSIGKISEIENIDPVEIISCAFFKSKLTKGQRKFLSDLQWHCKELKQPANIKDGKLNY